MLLHGAGIAAQERRHHLDTYIAWWSASSSPDYSVLLVQLWMATSDDPNAWTPVP